MSLYINTILSYFPITKVGINKDKQVTSLELISFHSTTQLPNLY